ncbi:MAG: hypothetical protein LBH61_02695 [Dysgonamonadaceae bacterium]|jgi:hypothetical protein|nr:hypothetical protein [Dysgonamonadaceae bacterium]
MEIRLINKSFFRQKTSAFFRSQRWKELLVFLVFVALAFSFWVLQYFQQKVEREIEVPIHYSNIPKDIILNDTLPGKFTLKLVDKGSVFLMYFLNKKEASIPIDLKDVPLNNTFYTIDKPALNTYIRDFLSNTTQLVSFKPEKLRINYSPLEKKEVPVILAGKIEAATGYIFTDSIAVKPSRTWIYGNKNTLDTLQYIATETVKEESVQKKLDLTLRLKAPQGVRLSTEKVRISGNVEEYTEKKFELPVVCYNSPEDVRVRFFPSTVEVICRIALSKYSDANANDLDTGVDYQDLSRNQGTNISLLLNRKPHWLIDYRIIPDKVEYLIEQKKEG